MGNSVCDGLNWWGVGEYSRRKKLDTDLGKAGVGGSFELNGFRLKYVSLGAYFLSVLGDAFSFTRGRHIFRFKNVAFVPRRWSNKDYIICNSSPLHWWIASDFCHNHDCFSVFRPTLLSSLRCNVFVGAFWFSVRSNSPICRPKTLLRHQITFCNQTF